MALVLFRPVGLKELALIAKAEFRAFPPRLPHQPIFYPVLDLDYARQIAGDWNPTDELSGYIGFVTRFSVDEAYVSRFPVQIAGSKRHRELWVPAEELDEFNANIVDPVRVVEAYPGPRFAEELDPVTLVPRSFL
jgi:hypothetical protein